MIESGLTKNCVRPFFRSFKNLKSTWTQKLRRILSKNTVRFATRTFFPGARLTVLTNTWNTMPSTEKSLSRNKNSSSTPSLTFQKATSQKTSLFSSFRNTFRSENWSTSTSSWASATASIYDCSANELISWMDCIALYRNCCCHNGNLIDIKIETRPVTPQSYSKYLFLILPMNLANKPYDIFA